MSTLIYTIAFNTETKEIVSSGNIPILMVIELAHQIAIDEAVREKTNVLDKEV